VVQWSEFQATDPEAWGTFSALQNFLRSGGLKRGPLSLVSTIEELLGRKSSSSGLENRKYGLVIRHTDHVAPSVDSYMNIEK
jgi:hypothetical protein